MLLLNLEKRKDKLNVDKDKYFKLINDSFKQKRKTLKNNLKDYDFNQINQVLQKHNLNDNIRAEEISEELFVEITNNL